MCRGQELEVYGFESLWAGSSECLPSGDKFELWLSGLSVESGKAITAAGYEVPGTAGVRWWVRCVTHCLESDVTAGSSADR